MPTERAGGRSERAPSTAARVAAKPMFVIVLALGAHAAASFSLELEAPPRLVVGDRARVVLVADVPRDVPILVTPTHEGTAVEVVRGRLTRADAADPTARPLRFPIPIIAKESGVGVLRATVTTFECDADDCQPRIRDARITLRIERER